MLLLERWTEPLAESNCYLLGEAGRAVVIDPNDPRGPLERLEAPLARGVGGGYRRVQRRPGGHPAQHDPEDGGLSRLPGQAGGVLSALRLPAGG